MINPNHSNHSYPVVETFHSVQGEGYYAGVNAFFIRLGGCDVGCWFCDTKESWDAGKHPTRTVEELVTEAASVKPAIVVVTGGEPLMHDLNPLTWGLRSAGLRAHLETSGAHPYSGNFDWVTLSPKKFKAPHPSVYPHVNELKVVVVNHSDLAWAEEHARRISPTAVRSLQPEWSTPKSRELIFQYVLRNPDWRISLQTHKFLEVR
ncbi:7-carboxy-7-deazaguanine synthase QueE [Calidithermus chliarophilus]|uniref:7-carboxy-7-deazaguanine synthase QueE n=1 Tax=Calidithermus chliarophilus TaxID=52023 RepID=UPI00040E542D|nr:7-carboxy-7-deazaguanine synthase QueE [Calidithermus chliarophilus]